ncbi:MAG TPA: amino acid adenylation domain-containing protein [Parapedobacter sp.]|uniref:non-ribosomal peptide synthetase n=1 Tax=Parapedobacter sp. TaxID=1958893 RepID=UPI002CB2E40C|nr:non-ribosomal peptide synthetase [Parapedobacter sp.]HWK56128.1 amino acid adenylation domain-containing protein [Parapedobacter sp.]
MTYDLIPVDYNPFFNGEIERIVPTAETQLEIWLSCTLGGHEASCAYNESISLRLEGYLNIKMLEKALGKIIQRHEALRYTFSADGRQIYVADQYLKTIQFEDISVKSEADQEHDLTEFGNRDAREPFDLQAGPLFRSFLFKLANDSHMLRLTAHHIICDGWSFGILLEELSEIYGALVSEREPALSEAIPMARYSREMEASVSRENYLETRRYWLEKFNTIPEPLSLPTDRPRPDQRTYKSRRDDFAIDPTLAHGIKRLGATHGLSIVNTLLIAFEVYLSKLTGQTDIVIGLPAAGQSATGYFNLVGHCVNLLPIRGSVQSSIPFDQHLKTRKSELLDDYDHQLFTLGTLLKSIKMKRDNSRVPLVPVVFNIDMGMDTNVSFPNINHTLISNPRAFENFEIFLNLTGSHDTFVLEWSYNTGLFNANTIEKMMTDFEAMLNTVVQEPSTLIGSLNISSQSDRKGTAKIGSSKEQDYPKDKPFFELISEAALRMPEKMAIQFGSTRLSYGDLDFRANQIAHYLQGKGIEKGDIVGLAVDRTISMVIALLGIAKSGAAYLPIDPTYPSDRIRYMLNDSGAKLLITNRQYIGTLTSHGEEVALETLEHESMLLPRHAPENKTKGHDLAYILYTSGSTGTPKGVEIEHHSLTNFLLSMQREPGITSADRLLAVTTISFDIAGLELYLPLTSGAELILADKESIKDARELLRLMDDTKTTIMQATPATWRMLTYAGWETKKTTKILCGGEPLPPDLAKRLLELGSEVWNMYGPTETTIWSTVKQIRANELPSVTVGLPIANTTIHILDERLNPVPRGETGQLFIGGEGVARGYHGKPKMTQERFLSDPIDPKRRIYATGDLGKETERGEIVCLGRLDHQVKIRGYRIELEEIEHQLTKQSDIKEAVVVAREDTPGDQRLVAYVVPTSAGDRAEQSITWKDKWDNIYHQGIRSEADLDLADQNLDVAIVKQLGNQADDLKDQTIEWLDSSTQRIKQLAPRRIFEVGSGAGQLMFELAAEVDQYIATDYAESAIKKLQEKIAVSPDTLGHARAYVAPADDFSCLNGVKPDLVLVHSVVQYFPDMDYLVKVVTEAANHMDQGCIFLGDIQGKNTLPIHHTADQLSHTKDNTTVGAFRKIVANRLRLEDELTMDPAFFYRIRELVPQITGVDVQLRRGKFLNEITKYHYDVWLYVNSGHTCVQPTHTESWQSLKRTEELLAQYHGKTVAVRDIPNHRTTRDLAITSHLESLNDNQAISTLRNRVEASMTHDHDGIDLNTLWDAAIKYGYNAHVRWSTDGTDGICEAVFINQQNPQLLPPPPVSIDNQIAIREFIRIPGETIPIIGKDQLLRWKTSLRSSLPDYMIPNDWVALEQLPLTSNNKIDRKALPKPTKQQHHKQEQKTASESQPDIEKTITQIWSSILNIEKIQPTDDFFELGGHSLLAVELMTKIERAINIRLPLTTLFDKSKFGDFLQLVLGKQAEISWKALVPIKPTGTKPPIYLIHGGGLNVLVYRTMVEYMDPEQPVYAFQALGLSGEKQAFDSIEEISRRYIEELLDNNPDGPYAIAGYSFGGLIAFEMAKQLKAKGKKILLLGIIDTYINNKFETDPSSRTAGRFAIRQLKKLAFFTSSFFHRPIDTIRYQYKRLVDGMRAGLGYENAESVADFAKHFEIYQNYNVAEQMYRIVPLDIKVNLFKAKERIYFLEEPKYLGWSNAALKGVNVYEIPGDHHNFLDPPNDRYFAKALQYSLNQAANNQTVNFQ